MQNTTPLTERSALARLIRALAKQGWNPVDVYDGGDPIPLAGMDVDKIVEECSATSDAHLRMSNGENTATMYLVWGNSPMELVANHSIRWGFEEAIDAALRSIWPLYPDDCSPVSPEVP